jgi:nucleoside-diphosphate-sugar epimerase
MSHVLVTGGAGFIGSHLADELLKKGHRVRVLDDLSFGVKENVPVNCEFIRGTILDRHILHEATRDIDVIFHEAARVTVRGSMDHFYEDAETNIMGTLRLLQAAAFSGVKRFVHASSMAVYADSSIPVPVSEDHPTVPPSPYGIGKLAAERYVLMMGPALGIQPVVLRYFNTFGARQTFTPYVGVITIFITRLLQKQSISLFGDGGQVRDFVHVSDVVQANLLAMQSPDAIGRIFNVGSGRGTTVLQLANVLKNKLNRDAVIEFEPERPEELRNSIADISLASNVLGYTPRTNLETQLSELIEYIRLNQNF